MEIDYLIAEIGSTTTVVNGFRGMGSENPEFLGQGQAPTTVSVGDVNIGLEMAIEDLRKKLNLPEIKYREMLATSSAAGGLKMSVHGLVYDMTVRAAREAALGAGANLKLCTSGKLGRFDLKKILEINPNIILLAGGVDYGERETAIHNAEKIVSVDLNVPVIFAGNIACQDEVREIFQEAGKEELLHITENVYPKIDTLNVEPLRKIIQKIFEDNITNAPGMAKIREKVSGHIMPTPGAVMEATKVLKEEIGDVVTIDIGGATTDVSSVTEGSEGISYILLEPEPVAKRSVEGDLGCYVSKKSVIELAGMEKASKELKMDEEKIRELLENLPPIPRTPDEIKLVEFIARESLITSMHRHAGGLKSIFEGPKRKMASGKDLTAIKHIVGTGGALTRLPNRVEILKQAFLSNRGDKLLPGEGTNILVDNDYIMASLGVLSKVHRESSIKLLKKSLEID